MTNGVDRIDDPRDLERYINETSGDVRICISDVHVTSTRSGRNVSRVNQRGRQDLTNLKPLFFR